MSDRDQRLLGIVLVGVVVLVFVVTIILATGGIH